MNIPLWLGERFAGDAVVEPPDGDPRTMGPVEEITWTASGLRATTAKARIDARFLSDRIVEVKVASPRDIDLPSFSRMALPLCSLPSEIDGIESVDRASLRSGDLELTIDRPSARIALATRDAVPLFDDDETAGPVLTDRGWRAQWALRPGDRVYGLGAKTGPLDHRGRRTLVWARDALVGEKSDPLYSAIPFFLLAREGRWLGVLLDSAAGSVFDFGHTAPHRLSFGPHTGALVYVVFAGPTLGAVLEQYTSLTGRAPLPPRWSLGHHQSRYSYNDEDEVREIAAEFRRRDIPTDAIHLDIHYMRNFRVFTFHRTRFPAPRRLAEDLARDGFRLVAIVDPGVKKDKRWPVYRQGQEGDHFTRAGAQPFQMKVWPGNAVFPDFYRAGVRRWWSDLHRAYTDAGIAGIWNDMNEPSGWTRAWYLGDGVIPFGPKSLQGATHRLDDGQEVAHAAVHNAYGHLQCRAAYEGLKAQRPDERPFVLTRSAFAGTQTYAAQWTGDIMSTWGALRQSLPMIVGLGLSGQPFAGSDIGGFMSDSNPELYARWMQIGALAPFCRTHTSLHTHRQEPWSFGARTEAIARGALRLRYQLLPYLYTCFREAARTGMPPWRPLFAEFPDDSSVRGVEDQVMVGPALLAAPILEPGAVARRVVLPPGPWFDWHSGEMLEGGRTIDADAPLERMPLYVRANSALPTQPEVRFADDRPEQPLIWEIFLTREGRGEVGSLYEDDGRTFAYRHGAFRTTLVSAEDDAVRFRRRDGDYRSPRREALVRLHGAGLAPLTLDGRITSSEGLVKMPHDDEEHVLALRWGE